MRAVELIILAGGASSRMGTPKESVRLADGRTMLDHAVAAVTPLGLPVRLSVPRSPGEYLEGYGLPLVRDRQLHDGPLAALARVLEETESDAILAVCCDQVLLQPDILQRLLQSKTNLPTLFRHRDGHSLAPFPALYPRELLPPMQHALARGERSPRRFLMERPCEWLEVETEEAETLASFNTEESLRAAGLLPPLR